MQKRKLNLATQTAVAALALAMGSSVAWAQTGQSMETVVVTGIRASEQKAVDLKRNAVSIQDSIVAEDIGKLPDTTISDSLQRITGVQIDRSAGEGSTVNIRGLPQVGTLLNGEAFITPGTRNQFGTDTGGIVGAQPDFTALPASLFGGADVIKSPTANLQNAGITGTVNLKTRRPYDLESGWTFTGAVEGQYGTDSDKIEPVANALIGYNDGKWGLLVSGSYADVTMMDSTDGMDQYGGQIAGENGSAATSWNGILTSYGVNNLPLPSQVHLLHPALCPRAANGSFPSYHSGTDCDVDIDGDGLANHAFYTTENFTALQTLTERQRMGFNASLQADLGQGFSVVSDFFYTDQKQYRRQVGYQINSASWLGATFIPLTTRNTGKTAPGPDEWSGLGDQLFTTQVYKKYLGDMETYSEDDVTKSTSRNYNFEMKYDTGGNFTGEVRAIYADAREVLLQSYVQFTFADGQQWNKQANLLPGQYAFPTAFPSGISSVGGLRMFNSHGITTNADYATVDTRGSHLAITLDPAYAAAISNESAYALKTVSGEGDYDRFANMTVLRADGHYKFQESGVSFDFGIRETHRVGDNVNFNLNAPVYGGDGAYTQNVDAHGAYTGIWTASSTGCYARWKAADVTLNDNTCSAGVPITNGSGQVTGFSRYYVANYYSGLSPTQLPGVISNNIKTYKDMAGVKGITLYNLNPKAMDNVMAFQNALFPGEIRNVDPGGTWHVGLAQMSGYVQANLEGRVYFPFSLNAGLKIIKTDLHVTQHAVGNPLPYGQLAHDNGVSMVNRSFTDVLPAINASVDFTDDLRMRLAYSKNMQLLTLQQWGGGLTLNYGIDTVTGLFPVLGGNSAGNPGLDPWRSTNYDASFEYYIGKSSMINFAVFYIEVASFIVNGSVNRCDLPDQDGVIRNRCVNINGPIQGAGRDLKGAEFGWKQTFDFLPGFLANTGTELNLTYSPSNVGTDLAGAKIPFPDNSTQSANLVLWYQDDALELRAAANYRSKRAVNQDWGGIPGLEMYQASTVYVDAAASYYVTPNWQVYVQGSNITNQAEHYYLVWKDQKGHTNQFEPRYTIGVRAKF
jgi:TonB-dependent receptor